MMKTFGLSILMTAILMGVISLFVMNETSTFWNTFISPGSFLVFCIITLIILFYKMVLSYKKGNHHPSLLLSTFFLFLMALFLLIIFKEKVPSEILNTPLYAIPSALILLLSTYLFARALDNRVRDSMLEGKETNELSDEFLEEQKRLSHEITSLQIERVRNKFFCEGKIESEEYRKKLIRHLREHFCWKGKYTVTALDYALERYFA